ncbi:MAG: hypothetical protein IID46_02800 [Planctomycetes bacterium]|nr:hypothetical protein [Planctomycetota bacterium]
MAKDLLDTNENFALHVLAAKLGIKVPDVTVDDMIQREIRRDPDLMRRLAEERVGRLLHRGKTEMELAEEAFGLAIKISEWKESGKWAGVVEKAVTSGEVRKIVEAFVGIKSTDRQAPSGDSLPQTTHDTGDAIGNTLPGGSPCRNDLASPPLVPPSDSKPQQPGDETGALRSQTPAPSPPSTPTLQREGTKDLDASLRPNSNRPQRKRHRLTDLSPEEREKQLRIIKQATQDYKEQINESAPAAPFTRDLPDGLTHEKLRERTGRHDSESQAAREAEGD